MLQTNTYKIAELFLLFVILPIGLTLNVPIIIKVATVLIGLSYCIWVSFKFKIIKKKSFFKINFKNNWKRLLLTFTVVVLSSSLFMYFIQPENLFIVIKKRPMLWLTVLFIYFFLSALPQELLYRSFFFERYSDVFNKPYYLIWANILVFPLAHLFFENMFVLVVTFVGGILFTVTYYRTKSVLFTSLEHALYGNWLFTIGMGEMLAFPMPS